MSYDIRARIGIDNDLVDAYRRLSTGTLGHRIDGHALDRAIRPVTPCGGTIAGPAVTVRAPGRDSTVCHKVMDLVQPGDVLVIDREGESEYACWGEMMTIAARLQGVAAVVIDGPVTDVAEVRSAGLPVFCRSASPLTTLLLGEGGSINAPVICGGLPVTPGDLVIADDDGVLILNADEARAVLAAAEEELEEDGIYKERLLSGLRPSQLAPIDELINQRLAIPEADGDVVA